MSSLFPRIPVPVIKFPVRWPTRDRILRNHHWVTKSSIADRIPWTVVQYGERISFKISLKCELCFEARWKFNYFFAREKLYVSSISIEKDFFFKSDYYNTIIISQVNTLR